MGRFSRRKPVTLEYGEPLFAVCYRDPKTGQAAILDKRGPANRESAQYYADLSNRFAHLNGIRAVLCPCEVYIDTSKLENVPAEVTSKRTTKRTTKPAAVKGGA
jgi:hypothetical protein